MCPFSPPIVVFLVFAHKNYAKTRHNGHRVQAITVKGRAMKQKDLTRKPSRLTRALILLGLSTVFSLGSTFVSILMPQSTAMSNSVSTIVNFSNNTTIQSVLVSKP
jgi:hypothetical protein